MKPGAYKEWIALVLSLIALWGIATAQFVTRADAAQDKSAVIAKWIEDAREKIERLDDEIIELTYNRPDLSEQARIKLIAKRNRQIEREQERIACLSDGRLTC